MSTDLGQRIREARERAGMTQQQVGGLVGVSLRTVGNWERGETVPLNRLARLEAVLATSLRDDADASPAAEATGEVPEGFARLTPVQREAVQAVVRAMLDPGQDARPGPGGQLVDLARPSAPDLARVAARRGHSEGRRLAEEQDRDSEHPS